MSDKQLREALRATYIALVGCEDLLDIIGDKCDVKAKADGDEFSVLGSMHTACISTTHQADADRRHGVRGRSGSIHA